MQAKGGDYEGATKAVMNIVEKLEGETTINWKGLLTAEAAGRLAPKMQEALNTLRSQGHLIPQEFKANGLLKIATRQLSRADYEAAEKTIALASSSLPSGPGQFLFQLASAIVQAKKGNFVAAVDKVGRKIAGRGHGEENALRVAVLNEIAVLQANGGDSRAAERTLQLALVAARAEDRPLHRAAFLSAVAVARARAGGSQAARHLLDEAVTNLEAAEGDILHLSYESLIAGRQAGAGFAAMGIETALGIHHPFNEIREAQLRVEGLVSIARELAGKPLPPWWYPQRRNFFWVWD